jgi:AcrR family transcriptional regulator
VSNKGSETRSRILQESLSQVKQVGFEGLTLGPLADRLGLSKSGLFAHFGSREELQLATLELAAQQFRDEVLIPALPTPGGLPRLLKILGLWFARYPQGGCPFLAGSAEYDDRPGPMREALARLHQEWRKGLAQAVRLAVEAGHLQADTDPDQMAFEIFALSAGAHHDVRLFGGKEPGRRIQKAILSLLRHHGAKDELLQWPPPTRK